MFVGHLAVGFAAKRLAPRTSLGTLLIAAELPDILWSVFLLTGVEHARIAPGFTRASPLDLYDFPISHSLLMDGLWAILFAGTYFLIRRYPRGTSMLALAILSHWLLDVLSHRPDMPVAPGLTGRYGLGVWNSIQLTYFVEGGLWLLGLAIYVLATQAKDRLGLLGFWSVAVLLTAIWITSVGGPPPPNITALAMVNGALLVIFGWAYWIDKHRLPSFAMKVVTVGN